MSDNQDIQNQSNSLDNIPIVSTESNPTNVISTSTSASSASSTSATSSDPSTSTNKEESSYKTSLKERRLEKKLLAKAKRENKIKEKRKTRKINFSQPIIQGPTVTKINQPTILKEKTIINEPIIYNERNDSVYVKKSNIPYSGNGLFAKKLIKKGEYVATYSGQLVDEMEAKYINPCYIVNYENGKGYKLVGDNLDGDTGHFANSICTELWIRKINDFRKEFLMATTKNAKLLSQQLSLVDKETENMIEINNNLVKNAKFDLNTRKSYGKLRGKFDLIAIQDIQKDEEIFVSYGEGYWNTVFNWMAYGPFIKPDAVLERDNRAKNREENKNKTK